MVCLIKGGSDSPREGWCCLWVTVCGFKGTAVRTLLSALLIDDKLFHCLRVSHKLWLRGTYLHTKTTSCIHVTHAPKAHPLAFSISTRLIGPCTNNPTVRCCLCRTWLSHQPFQKSPKLNALFNNFYDGGKSTLIQQPDTSTFKRTRLPLWNIMEWKSRKVLSKWLFKYYIQLKRPRFRFFFFGWCKSFCVLWKAFSLQTALAFWVIQNVAAVSKHFLQKYCRSFIHAENNVIIPQNRCFCR